MSDRNSIQALLAEFGRSIGITDLAFDASGYCILVFDDALVVNMEIDEAEQGLLLYSLVGNPAGEPGIIYEALLRANFRASQQDAPIFGMADGKGITLSKRIPLAGLELSSFNSALEQFVNAVEHWTARLPQLGASAPEPETAMPASFIRG